MAAPIISVHNLGKRYNLGATLEHDTLRDHIAHAAQSVVGLFRGWNKTSAKRRLGDNEIWALKDVSFEAQPGEVIGIIGHNGAGKSTLLKILSQITEPTEGEIRIRGKLASLLEVGTGFHPELSGRENIYLNGAILGMSRAEINRRFDEITAFAEIGKFLDTPVKRYSSGMYVRLAFAVAAHLESEILIVDEVLAVGDASFQAKCMAKMGDVARQSGRTILFVSHNMQAIRGLCQNCLLLEHGRLTMHGETKEVVNRYMAEAAQSSVDKHWSEAAAPGNHEVKLLGVKVYDEHNPTSGIFSSRNRIFIEMEFLSLQPCSSLCIGFDLLTPEGEVILRTYDTDQEPAKFPEVKAGRNLWRCEIPAGLLNSGTYLIAPKITRHTFYWIANLGVTVRFDVVLDHGVSPYWTGLKSRVNRPGVISPILKWEAVCANAVV